MGALIMFGLVTAIAILGVAYFAYQDNKKEKQHSNK